jgi:hypothetical protein
LAGQFLGLNLNFHCLDGRGQQVKGKSLNLLLASVYHLCHDVPQEAFAEHLHLILAHVHPNAQLIIAASVNAKLGHHNSDEMAAVLGPHGPPCCNVSGSNLLALYLSHNLRVENIFFDASYHCTFTNIRNGDGTMIDIFTCAKQLHCCVHNCQAVTDEVESNHLAVHLNLSLILFKHTSSSTLNRGTTDWHKIITDKATNICYNDLLLAPHLTNPHHMKILTKKSRKWAKKLPYHLSPSTITGSSSTRTNMPSRLTNATN